MMMRGRDVHVARETSLPCGDDRDMNKNESCKGIGYWGLYLGLPVVLVIIWQLADVVGWIHPYSMPSPVAVVETTWDYIQTGELLDSMVVSVVRVLEGFLLALVTATLLGIAAALFPRFEIATDLVLQIIRPIPPIAWIPLAILWFGIGQSSKIFIIFLGAFFPIFVNTVDGIKNIDPRYLELSRAYEVPGRDLIRYVVIPGALPSIMTGIRLGLGSAWVCVVAAEMIGAISGVGYMLSNGRSLSRPDIVILGMLIVGIVGKLMDDVLCWLRKRIIVWN